MLEIIGKKNTQKTIVVCEHSVTKKLLIDFQRIIRIIEKKYIIEN